MQNGMRLPALTLVFLMFWTAGCSSVYYATWEKLGKHKRDLLRDFVLKARNDQAEAKEAYKDALTRLKELTGFEGGKLEAAYRSVEKDYQNCESRATTIHKRIADVEDVARALFDEWEAELKTYQSDSLRASSKAKLQETRKRYEALHAALKRSESSMTPVLARLKDQVLYLKHNLNAQAVGALREGTLSIEGDIQKLIADMNTAISQADEFVKGLP